LKDFKSPFIPLSKGGNLALPIEKLETNSPFEKGGKGGFWTYYVYINQVFFATILIMAFLSIQNAYCANVDLYIFSTSNNDSILLKMQSFAGEDIQIVLKEETVKDGNMKIYKPVMQNELWDYWKFNFFLNLAKIRSKDDIIKSTPYDDYIIFYRFIQFIREQVKSGYSSTIQFAGQQIDITVYDVRKMLEAKPNEDIIRRLGSFGYGIANASGVDLIKKSQESSISVVLPIPFKELFANSIRQFAEKIQQPTQISPYLFIILPCSLIIIGLIIFSIYIFRKSQRLQLEKAKIMRDMSEMERKNRSVVEKPNKNIVDYSQRDRYCLDLSLNAISDIHQILTDQVIAMQAGKSVIKIGSLLESISAKVSGNWIDVSKKRLSQIVQDMVKTTPSITNIPKPESIDEFKQVDWRKEFIPVINSIIASAESSNEPSQESQQILANIGRDVIVPIVDAIDREKSKRSLDISIDDDLRQLLIIAGIKESDVKIGAVYNQDLHELVVMNDPSLVTDREQKISKIVSRGLVLSNGNIIKAKVSIQKQRG
jgi:hypothetical protein